MGAPMSSGLSSPQVQARFGLNPLFNSSTVQLMRACGPRHPIFADILTLLRGLLGLDLRRSAGFPLADLRRERNESGSNIIMAADPPGRQTSTDSHCGWLPNRQEPPARTKAQDQAFRDARSSQLLCKLLTQPTALVVATVAHHTLAVSVTTPLFRKQPLSLLIWLSS